MNNEEWKKHRDNWLQHQMEIIEWYSKIHTKEIRKVYDRESKEAWLQLIIADDLCDYFTFKKFECGLNLSISNLHDFGYTIADHHDRKGFYVFVIKDKQIIKTKWVDKRKNIGLMIHKYQTFNLITFYPVSESFRFYIQQQWEYGNKYLGLLKRVTEQEFIKKVKK